MRSARWVWGLLGGWFAIGGALSACRTAAAPQPGPPPPSDEVSGLDLQARRPVTPVEGRNEYYGDRDRTRRAGEAMSEADRTFADAVPTAAQLALEVAGPLSAAGEVHASDVREVVATSFAGFDDALALVHDRIEWLIAPPATSVAEGEGCRVWSARDPTSTWRLRVCLVDPVAHRHELALFGRSLTGAARGEPEALVAAGESVVGSALALEGRLGYDLDAFRIIEKRGGAGRVTVAFRITAEQRAMNISLNGYSPAPDISRVSTTWEYESVPASGGRASLATVADLLTAAKQPAVSAAPVSRGADELIDLVGVSVAWRPEGDGRAVATACTGGTHGYCGEIRQCWGAAGESKFENFTLAGKRRLGWSETECAAGELSPGQAPDPRGIVSDAATRDSLPDDRVAIPGAVASVERLRSPYIR